MPKVGFFSSLRFQITMTISVTVITAVVLMGLLVSYLSRSTVEEERSHLGQTTASFIQRALARPTAAESLAGQEGLVRQASRIADHFFDGRYHHSLTFYSTNDQIIYSTLPASQWPYANVFATDLHVPTRQIRMVEMEDPVDGQRVYVYRFNWYIGGINMGRVQFVIPAIPESQRFLFSWRLIAVFAGAYALFIIFLGVLLLKQMIIRPVSRLNDGVRRLMRGERGFQLKETDIERNELGALAHSFNEMAATLHDNELRQGEQIEELLRVNDELELTRRSLIRSEKLASIGRLAAGVAHEVGNPLSAILGYVDLLRAGGLDEDTQKDFLSRIEKDITRISNIIRGLLEYSRPQKERIETLDLNVLMDDTIDLLQPQKQFKTITFDFTSHHKPACVRADHHQLQQVLVNLFMNASHAMNESGPITIFLERVEYDPSITFRETADKFKRGESLIALAVIDQGVGIDEATQARIFDPFFTTKEPGRGTGLGLSVSDKIIDGFGGSLQVSSQPGEGATFMILLPEARDSDDWANGGPGEGDDMLIG